MTTASVKGAGSILAAAAVPGYQNQSVGSSQSFQDIWNNRTRQNGISEGAGTKGDSLSSKELAERSRNENSGKKVLKETGAEEEERAERAAEVLGAAAAELFAEVAQVLGISEEELQSLMDGMDMEPADLLDRTKLGELILKAAGTEDLMSLLTNGELFTDYKQLMNSLTQVLQQSRETLRMEEEEFRNLLTGTEAEQLPEITVDVTKTPQAEPEMAQDDLPEEVLKEQKAHLNTDTRDEAAAPLENTAGKADTGKEKQGAGQKNNGESSNLLLQNIRQELTANQTGTVQQTMESYFSTQTQDIMRQVMDFMRIQVKPDLSELQMQLHPENLGTLQVHVASKGGMLTAQFITQNEAVKAALETQMIQLQESFAEQGVKVEAIEVTVQTHSFEQNLEQGRGRGQQEAPEQRSRARRINLNDLTELNGVSGLDEEEQLAAKLMEANGNTVDYTA